MTLFVNEQSKLNEDQLNIIREMESQYNTRVMFKRFDKEHPIIGLYKPIFVASTEEQTAQFVVQSVTELASLCRQTNHEHVLILDASSIMNELVEKFGYVKWDTPMCPILYRKDNSVFIDLAFHL